VKVGVRLLKIEEPKTVLLCGTLNNTIFNLDFFGPTKFLGQIVKNTLKKNLFYNTGIKHT
jgi:hypothetical protein